MYRVLVADDEPRHRRGLAEMIRRLRPDYEVAEARNGEEAIAAARAGRTDIAVTDIRMPVRDGLEFLEATSDLRPGMKTIVLSGYANFQYAQKALQLGATDYVLKPVNEERVDDMLRKVEKIIEGEQITASHTADAIHKLNSTLPVYLQHQLNQWIRNRLTAAETGEIAALFGPESHGMLMVTEISNYPEATAGCTPEDLSELRMNIRFWLKEALSPGFHVISFSDATEENRMISILTGKQSPCRPECLPWEALEAFHTDLKTSYGIEAATGVSQCVPELLSHAAVAWKQALEALEKHFYENGKCILVYSENHWQPARRVLGRFVEETGLSEAVRRMDSAGASEVLGHLTVCLRASKCMQPEDLKNEVMMVLHQAAKPVQAQMQPEAWLELVADMKAAVGAAPDCDSLIRLMEQQVQHLIHGMESGAHKRNERVIQSCREYVEIAYAEDLTLAGVSEKYGFNPNYFGSLFKQNTHMTFLEYLVSVRMKYARELLKNQALRVYEVAARTGYRDVKYFIRVFRKVHGLAPEEFRRTEAARGEGQG